jgi:peptide/nickel transport system permease protein
MADGIASSTAANNADGGAVVNRGKRRGLGLQFWIPACFLAALLFVAITAPWIGIKDPYEGDFINLQVRPNEEFLFGTDVLGRDILARMVYGARISLTVGFAAPGIGLAFGLVIGLMAGYFRGWVDEVIVIAIDTWLAIPGLVILLLFSTALGGSLTNVCIGLGLLFIPAATRITRAATMTYARREFVLAAKAMGASNARVIMLEVFPNVIWPVIAYILVAIPIAIVVEGALSFLGLSVPSPNPSWGGMIAEGREHIEETPHITLIPMAIMFLTVLSFNLAGDVVRRRMADVREASI